MEHVHESPLVMTAPLGFLAVGAIFAGWLAHDLFVVEHLDRFWRASILVLPEHQALEHAHHAPLWVKILPIAVAVAGIAGAIVAYVQRPDLPAAIAARFRPLYLFFLNKWYFDEFYERLFVRPAHALGRGFWKAGDGELIDGVGPDGIAAATVDLAKRAGRLQSGYVYHYAFAMLIGVVGFITWYLYGRG
jgi:NADH-quinone oxidoreductase subunit L